MKKIGRPPGIKENGNRPLKMPGYMKGKTKIKAKCPRCGVEHETWLWFTGTVKMPRINCPLCQQGLYKEPSEEHVWSVWGQAGRAF